MLDEKKITGKESFNVGSSNAELLINEKALNENYAVIEFDEKGHVLN